jgi:hypothetical protein
MHVAGRQRQQESGDRRQSNGRDSHIQADTASGAKKPTNKTWFIARDSQYAWNFESDYTPPREAEVKKKVVINLNWSKLRKWTDEVVY